MARAPEVVGFAAGQPRQFGDGERCHGHRPAGRRPRARDPAGRRGRRRRGPTRCRSTAWPGGATPPEASRTTRPCCWPATEMAATSGSPRHGAAAPIAVDQRLPPGSRVLFAAGRVRRRDGEPTPMPTRLPSSTCADLDLAGLGRGVDPGHDRRASPHAEQELGDELVEALVAVARAPPRRASSTSVGSRARRAPVRRARRGWWVRPARAHPASTRASWISGSSRKRAGLVGQDQVGAHAAAGEVPHAVGVLGAVGVGVEVAHALPAGVLEQRHQVEGVADALAAEAEVLVVTCRCAAR